MQDISYGRNMLLYSQRDRIINANYHNISLTRAGNLFVFTCKPIGNYSTMVLIISFHDNKIYRHKDNYSYVISPPLYIHMIKKEYDKLIRNEITTAIMFARHLDLLPELINYIVNLIPSTITIKNELIQADNFTN